MGAACVQGDLLDPSLVESLFTGRIGLVIHLAALLSSAAEKHPDLAWQINADATWNLMRQSMSHAEARAHGAVCVSLLNCRARQGRQPKPSAHRR